MFEDEKYWECGGLAEAIPFIIPNPI